MPKFECHYCTQHIDADDSLSGRDVACPTCGTMLIVPLATLVERQSPNTETTAEVSRDLLHKTRNIAGIAALAAMAISALCEVIDYASRGAIGATLFSGSLLIGQTLGRWFAAIFVAAVISAAIAGVAHLLKKPFALMFLRAFTWVVVAASLPQLVGSIGLAGIAPLVKQQKAREEQDRAARQAYSATLATLEDSAKAIAAAAEIAGASSRPLTATEEGANPVAESKEISTIISGFAQDAIAARKEYEQALQKAGIGTLLDGDRMAKDTNFTETLAILMKVRSAAKRNREQFNSLMASLPKRVDGLELSDATQQSLLAGLEKGFQKSMPLMQEGLDLEDKVVDLFEKVVDHLIATKGNWRSSNGMFMFYEDADLEVFNNLMQQVNDCVQRQQQIQQAAAEDTSMQIESFKQLLRE